MSGRDVRFGVLIPQDATAAELVDRWQAAEDLGFDAAYVADHVGDHRDLGGCWLDGWTVLAHVAPRTRRLRVGTLVSNPLLHHPVQLAKQAASVDHLSGGRLELGIGTGIAGFDHEAVGEPYWSPAERAAHFAEYVAVVEGVLRAPSRTFRHQGRWYRSEGVPLNPAPLGRLPITVGGQSPTVLRVAAERADCWNTHGPPGRAMPEIAEVTAAQCERLDELCRAAGRDPGTLRRSLLLFDSLDAWAAPDRFGEVVAAFRPAGVHEFVVFWPPADRLDLLHEAAQLLPALRR